VSLDPSTLDGTWDQASLPGNVRVGTGCWLERRGIFEGLRSAKDPAIVLGDRVKVFTWTTFNLEPGGSVAVGDDSVLVGPTFMCADHIEIGRRVVISYRVTVADSDFHPAAVEERRRDALANAPHGDRSMRPTFTTAPVVIEDGVWIGIGAIVLKGVRIGRDARIGPGAVVTRDVPAGAALAGNPARPVDGPSV
jgi:acetyltransferase-like isoleucine patch superfamily enzyme